jgi:hypothetical protein
MLLKFCLSEQHKLDSYLTMCIVFISIFIFKKTQYMMNDRLIKPFHATAFLMSSSSKES